ncbi:MAG: RDD family protein [Limibacillus sp.]|jgi:uncharacterized RDD family membrane protein YckC
MTKNEKGGLPMRLRLPERASGRAWEGGAAPDPLEDPQLYDGVPSRRVFAWLIDAMIMFFLIVAVWAVAGLVSVASFFTLGPLSILLAILTVAFLPVLYHGYFIGAHGASPGMALLDLEVRSWTGDRPEMLQGYLHAALFVVTVAPSTWIVLVVALMNERRRCLHDYLAGTVVVRASRLAERASAGLAAE